ncbi:folate-binding protein YgfZ [Aquamicrobium sp. LC103]|uniref:CAF17-like 4Fe-4S cluster assembly/insertion protein YgfZ n=1 Tax=Aquamicrobium sp. LC103 TaxID=1120658 RepID=UPI00063E7FF0|nr:folate-binding protein YgfZ [Aquamicrobium sp. LC103]TKT81315.1 folate-binding protein YgfZ [Aquamicrobium sp. LC103]
MPAAHLIDRALVVLDGPDAEHFLQNILTTDLDMLKPGEAKPGALLTPQGKIMFDFLVSRTSAGAMRLECRADVADDFIRRLMLYRLRAKVEIRKEDQALVAASWDSDSGSSENDSTFADMRFASEANVRRHYGELPQATASLDDWTRLRIIHGVAESGTDYQLGDAFPHDVLLDQNGGVGLKKGCYIGQEVVSRMQHRGTARRRVMIARGASALPGPGAEITANGRTIGALGSMLGSDAIAIVRIDRVKDALDAGNEISAGDVPLSLSIPSWATYTLPRDAAGAGEA